MDFIETDLDIPCVTRITPREPDEAISLKRVHDSFGYHPDMGPDPYNKFPNRDYTYVIINEDKTKEYVHGIENLAFYFGLRTIRMAEKLIDKKRYLEWGVVDIKIIKRKRSNKNPLKEM